jgi:hypothetical protein
MSNACTLYLFYKSNISNLTKFRGKKQNYSIWYEIGIALNKHLFKSLLIVVLKRNSSETLSRSVLCGKPSQVITMLMNNNGMEFGDTWSRGHEPLFYLGFLFSNTREICLLH